VKERRIDMHLILSLDGGGIRGALTARVIERLEEEAPFLDRVAHVAGTSIGGINALYLAAGKPAGDMVELFRQHGKTIFKHRDWWDRWSGKLDEFYRANYEQDGLKEILDDVFGDDELGSLQKRVLISAFDLDNGPVLQGKTRRWKAKFFHNFDTKGNDRKTKIVDAALATSAAPTYFPSWQGYVDGGIAANNPSMCALAKAMKTKVALDDVRLLSLGTGLNAQYVDGDEHGSVSIRAAIDEQMLLVHGRQGPDALVGAGTER